jgi:hypothetical protein
VLAAHLGYCTLCYDLYRGSQNSAVICMWAECVPSWVLFFNLCNSHGEVWCLFPSWTVQRTNYQSLHVLCTAMKPSVEELQGYLDCPSSFNKFLNVDQLVLATNNHSLIQRTHCVNHIQWTLEPRTQSVPGDGSTFRLFDFRVKMPHKK